MEHKVAIIKKHKCQTLVVPGRLISGSGFSVFLKYSVRVWRLASFSSMAAGEESREEQELEQVFHQL